MALHEIQRLVPFTRCAMTIRFATLAGALRERATKETFAGGESGDAGTETALGGGEFGATDGAVHILYIYYIRQGRKTRAKTQCEYARMSPQVRTTPKQQ